MTGTTTLSQSRPGSNGNEEVLHTTKCSAEDAVSIFKVL